MHCFFETIYYSYEKIREVWNSNDFLKFIYQISIKFWITNTLLHVFQTDVIFFYQFKVPTIKVGKCGVYDADSLAYVLTVKNLLRLLKSVTCEDALAKRISSDIYAPYEGL